MLRLTAAAGLLLAGLHLLTVLLLSLVLVAVVLKPDLHLSRGQANAHSHLLSLGGRKVFLRLKSSLQLIYLWRISTRYTQMPCVNRK